MTTFVPSETKVRRSRVQNIDNLRLYRRRLYLVYMVRDNTRDFECKGDWLDRVAELSVIETEMTRRGILNETERYLTPQQPGCGTFVSARRKAQEEM